MKIPNSFSATIFNRHRIQYESSSLDTEFSNVFFCLPSTTDRIEEINRYVNSVNLIPTDIDPSAFGKNFDPLELNFENEDKRKMKDSVLKVLRKVVDFFQFQPSEECRRTACYKTPQKSRYFVDG